MKRIIAVILGTILALGASAATAAAETIFDYVPSPLPDNVASYSYESWGVAEAGDGISFSTSGPQTLDNAKVVVSSWACQVGTGWAADNTVPCVTTPGSTFSVPITLNIYTPGLALIASRTRTFDIPFRPSSNPACDETVNGQGWGADCFLGLSHVITFDLTGVVVPDEIVYGVAWNTSSYGYAPIDDEAACAAVQYAGCPYDLLNLGVEGDAQPDIGADESPNGAYQYSVFPSAYCDGGTGGSSVFRLDDGCWGGFNPLVRFSRFVEEPAGGGGGGGGTPPPTVDCTITGTAGADLLIGTPGNDVICAKAGDDIVRARGGADVVRAGAGNDRVRGNLGDDFLAGNAGNDRLRGGPGFDICRGGRGVDILRGCEA
jgi:RTX calcium-binding nonapeptide repeat (4 copies)